MRKQSIVCVAIFFFLSAAAFSHPHMFVTLSPHVISDATGVVETEIEWMLDEFNSDVFLSDCDKNSNRIIDPEEMPLVKEHYLSVFEKSGYYFSLFVHKKSGDEPDRIENIQPYVKEVLIKNRQACFILSVPYSIPFAWTAQTLVYYFDENENFISFRYNRDRSPRYTKQSDIPTPAITAEGNEEYPNAVFVRIGKLQDDGTSIEGDEIETIFQDFGGMIGQRNSLKARFYALQGRFNQNMSELVMKAKDGMTFGLTFLIFFFAVAYGFIHSAGPGHGKTFVVGFFLRHDAHWWQALPFAGLIALIHTGSAIILSALFLTILNSFNGMERLILQTQLSFGVAIFILGLGIWLLVQQYFFHSHHHGEHSHDDADHNLDHDSAHDSASHHHPHDHSHAEEEHAHINPSEEGHSHHHHEESPEAMKKSMFRMALAAGIIPCPLSITIMLLSVTNNMFFLGFLTVFGIAVGIILVLSGVGILTIKTKDKVLHYSETHQGHDMAHTIHHAMDYASAVLIILLGIGLTILYLPSF